MLTPDAMGLMARTVDVVFVLQVVITGVRRDVCTFVGESRLCLQC
jgi:hypothetical protein